MVTVLIVDASYAVREAVATVLEVAQYRVLAAASGAEALATVTVERPDVVLLDLSLPDMSAFVHPQNATTCCSNQLYYDDPSIDTSKWHDYTIEWTASAIRFYADSTLVGQDTNTSTIPHTPMHWVLQTNLSSSNTDYSLAGHLQIAWVVAYTPA